MWFGHHTRRGERAGEQLRRGVRDGGLRGDRALRALFLRKAGGVPYLLAATTDGGPDTEPGATEELLASSPHFSPDEQETLRLLVGTGELAAASPAAVHHRGVHGGREDGAARRPRPRAGPRPPR